MSDIDKDPKMAPGGRTKAKKPGSGPSASQARPRREKGPEKRAEAEIERLRQRLRDITELATDYVIEASFRDDGSVAVDAMTGRFYEIMGYTPDELQDLDETIKLLVHPDDREAAERLAMELAAGRSGSLEARLLTRDRTARWFEVHARPVWDERHEKVVGMVGTGRDVTAERERERELERSAERYRLISEMTSDYVSTVQRDQSGQLRVTFMSDSFGRLLGYPLWKPGEIENDRRELVHPADLARYRENIGRVLAGETHRFETRLLTSGGIYKDIELHLRPFWDRDHTRVEGFHASGKDITERKRAEELLRESETRLAAIVDNLPVGIWSVDATGGVTAKNSAADLIWRGNAPLSGSAEEYAEYLAWNVETGKRLESEDYPLARTLRTGRPVDPVELRIRRFDGTEGIVMMTTAPLRGPDGLLTGAVGINVDITERKRMETALSESEARFRLALKNSPVVVAMQDRDLVYRWAYNTRTRRPEDVIGKTDADLFAPEDLPSILEVKRQALETGAEAHLRRWFTSNGRRVFLDCYYEPLRGPDGEVIGVGVAAVNLTEQQLAEEALHRELEVRAAMTELSQALVETRTLEEISWLVYEKARSLTGSPLGFAHYVDKDTGWVLAPTLTGEVWDRCQITDRTAVFKDWKGMWGWPLASKKSIIVNDPKSDPRSVGTPAGHLPITRFLCAPAMLGDEVVGLVAAANAERDYTDEDEQRLRRLAAVYAVAIARERSRQELKQSEERFRSALDGMIEGCQIIAHDWRYLYINPAAEVHNRRPAADMIGKRYLDMWPGIEDTQVFRVIERALAGRAAQRMENEFEFPDGHVGWFHLSIQPVPEGALILSYDISEQKRAERELHAHREHLEELVTARTEETRQAIGRLRGEVTERRRAEQELQVMNEVLEIFFSTTHLKIAYLDREFNFLRVNRSYADAVGETPEFFAGKNHFALFPHEENERIFRGVVETGEPFMVSAKPFEYPDRSELGVTYWDWTLYPIKDGKGEVQAVVLYLVDVTDNERMRRELEQQRTLSIHADRLRSLGEMAAGIAHELNQPLMGIRNMAEHLVIGIKKGWAVPPESVSEKAGAIVEQVDRMSHVIEHSRVFARGGAEDAGARPVQVNDAVNDSLTLVRSQFKSQGIELRLELAPDLPLTLINPFSLEEVVLNLVNNARDACLDRLKKQGGSSLEVRVRTFAAGEGASQRVILEVSDQGPGMPEEVRARAFEPFFSTKDPGKGTGLGLSICRTIVERYQGSMALESRTGEGAKVTVSLPAEG